MNSWNRKNTRTTPYHPESDGLVERLNKILISMVRSLVDEDQRDWDTLFIKSLTWMSIKCTINYWIYILRFNVWIGGDVTCRYYVWGCQGEVHLTHPVC